MTTTSTASLQHDRPPSTTPLPTACRARLPNAPSTSVHRGLHCFVCLNAYRTPLPRHDRAYEHLASLAAVPADAANELMLLAQRTELVLREVTARAASTWASTLGEAAGAGIADHIHMHVLPRWLGDTNFMTVHRRNSCTSRAARCNMGETPGPFKI